MNVTEAENKLETGLNAQSNGVMALTLGLLLVVGLVLYWSSFDIPRYVDEQWHHPQIEHYAAGGSTHNKLITTLPGLHVASALVANIIGTTNLQAVRGINLVYSFIMILFVAFTLRRIDGRFNPWRLLQIFFLPILFTYYTLVYTDCLSLLGCIGSFYFLYAGRPVGSGFMAGLAILVRQPNVVFVATSLLYDLSRYFKRDLSFLRNLGFWQVTMPRVLVLALFGGFFLYNQGVAFGDRGGHKSGLYCTNIFFFLLTSFAVFLPVHLANGMKVLALLRRQAWKMAALSALLLMLYHLRFNDFHSYNLIRGFGRNDLLMALDSRPWLNYGLFLPMLYVVFSLMVTPLKNKHFYALVYPLTVCYLLPAYLIEFRYYIVPMVFWQLFRAKYPEKVEYWLTGYTVVLAVLVHLTLKYGWSYL